MTPEASQDLQAYFGIDLFGDDEDEQQKQDMDEIRKVIRNEVRNVLSEARAADVTQYPQFVQEAARLMNRPIVRAEERSPGTYYLEFRGTLESGVNIEAFGRKGIRVESVGYYRNDGIIHMRISD